MLKFGCVYVASCPYLHHNNGDTERHYHLRYFKTEKCIHPTNSSGICSKNGVHCMFAHGDDDLRDPVYDLTLQAVEHATGSNSGTGIAVEKCTGESEQTYHLDPLWTGRYLPAVFLHWSSPMLHVTALAHWHCLHSMWNGVYDMLQCPSICPSMNLICSFVCPIMVPQLQPCTS